MDEHKKWHLATFEFRISSYKLKKYIPTDPEENLAENVKVVEIWKCGEDFSDGMVIGVTKWKKA